MKSGAIKILQIFQLGFSREQNGNSGMQRVTSNEQITR